MTGILYNKVNTYEQIPVRYLMVCCTEYLIPFVRQERSQPMSPTYLSQAVDATNDSRAAYDANVKYLLADKQILSRILKYAVCEFQDIEIDDIISCIGDDIEIGTTPIDPGLSKLGRVRQTHTEDNVPGEGLIFYDIRFTAYIKEQEIKFLINIEAQKSSDPAKLGYHLENRILYYLARMISAQKQTEFFHSDFDNLKRVRSIWICMDQKEDGDSIEEIGLSRRSVFGESLNPYGLDLMKAIIIHIRNGKDLKTSHNILISMLETLLSQIGTEDKKRLLAEKYGMVMTEELEGRIKIMCNLSENIQAEGIKRGIEKGIKKERLDAIERMIRANASREQILSYGYTQDEYDEAENTLPVNS